MRGNKKAEAKSALSKRRFYLVANSLRVLQRSFGLETDLIYVVSVFGVENVSLIQPSKLTVIQ